MSDHRIERDTMGEMKVPAEALYGAQTQRAVENFPVSGLRLPRAYIRALGIIKAAAAETNAELGHLEPDLAAKIREAAREVADGAHDSHFVVDVFQTGSGTSTNMNANEVIAHLAGAHPNDHVNQGQSIERRHSDRDPRGGGDARPCAICCRRSKCSQRRSRRKRASFTT